jgi:hypothetical protein
MGSWLLSREVGPDATLSEAIQALFDGLADDQDVWKMLTSQFKVELVCELTLKCFNRGWEIPPKVLKRLAVLGVILSFDVYYMGDLREREAILNRVEG